MREDFFLQDEYQGKLHGLFVPNLTEEDFEHYDVDDDEILNFDEWNFIVESVQA